MRHLLKTSIKIFFFCFTSFVFIGCDRVTKDLAKQHLMNKETASYFHDTFRLTYVENTGAALGLGDTLPQPLSILLLSILPLIFLAGLLIYTLKKAQTLSIIKLFSLSMIFAGGIGNIIDRILFNRHVTDFMNLGILNFRTGIFNFADVCVTSGVIGLILFYKNKKIAV
jgi:signal peptidase II